MLTLRKNSVISLTYALCKRSKTNSSSKKFKIFGSALKLATANCELFVFLGYKKALV